MSTIHAFKERDAQIQALETGRTALVIRKGGIVEVRGEFEVEHLEFWLYPTFLQQNLGKLRSPFSSLLRPDPALDQDLLRVFAAALEFIEISKRFWITKNNPARGGAVGQIVDALLNRFPRSA